MSHSLGFDRKLELSDDAGEPLSNLVISSSVPVSDSRVLLKTKGDPMGESSKSRL